jgi:hypothetical protein
MLKSREIPLDLNGEGSMLVQLLTALLGDVVFGSITSRHRRFHAEMLRYLEARERIPPGKPPLPQK